MLHVPDAKQVLYNDFGEDLYSHVFTQKLIIFLLL